MSNVIQLQPRTTTQEVISSVLCDAKPTLVTYRFSIIPETPKKVEALLETVLSKLPNALHVATRKLVESSDAVEVVFETTLPGSATSLDEKRRTLGQVAKRLKAEVWNSYVVGGPLGGREPDAPKGVKLMMRTEFLADALELRLALFPYVIHWADHSVNLTSRIDCPAEADNMGRNIELELSASAPSLDHLRWYINQMVDMHVAAQTLHYADQYTGARLPYRFLDEIEPPAEVIEELLKGAKEAAKWKGSRNCALRGLVKTLSEHLERAKSTV